MVTGPALTRFRKKLLGWFADFQRDLPWRRTRDPYRVWLSEIMLQQTRVAAAIPYYERFLEHFPDVRALAKAPEEDVLRLWAGLGYYSRARNLQEAARRIVEEHNAHFPEDAEEVLALPGIGRYTAAAILSIAYGKKMAVLDGNVARVLARLGAIRGDLRNGGRWQELQKTADALLSQRAPGDWNQAMMELGATICTPRSPQCLLCPAGEFCQARKLGLTDIIPEKRNKRANVEITLAALVLIEPQGRTLLLPPPHSPTEQTHESDVAVLLSRMWHFPTVQVQGEAEEELREFARKTVFGGKRLPAKLVPLEEVHHAVTYRQITILPFRLEVASLPAVEHTKVLPLDDLSSLPISNLTRKVARAALAASRSAKLEQGKYSGVLRF